MGQKGRNPLFWPTPFLLMACAAVGLCQQPGTLRWRAQIAGPTAYGVISSPAIGGDGYIYIGNWQPQGVGTNFYSISPQGTTNWILTCTGGIISSPSIGPDGTIYFGTTKGQLYSVNPAGTTNWVFTTFGQIPSSPAIAADGTIYFEAFLDGEPYFEELLAVRADGTLRWACSMGSAIAGSAGGLSQFSSPAIGPDGTIYAGSVIDHRLYAISPKGTTNWLFALNNAPHSSPSIGDGGVIYIGTDSNTLYAVSSRGTENWHFQTGYIVESSAVIASDGTILFGSLDGGLYALDPRGVQLWRHFIGSISSSPAAASDGTIYVAGVSSGFLALTSTGSNLWKFPTPLVILSSPAVAPDGTIYLAIGQWLYAIFGSAPLAESPWPMFRRDLQHHARAVQCGLTTPKVMGDGTFGIALTMETGLTYHVQASPDLTNWTDLTNFVSPALSMPFNDPDWTKFEQRFYRLATP